MGGGGTHTGRGGGTVILALFVARAPKPPPPRICACSSRVSTTSIGAADSGQSPSGVGRLVGPGPTDDTGGKPAKLG